jgi:imidazolonepropionase-like amidohydrolase
MIVNSLRRIAMLRLTLVTVLVLIPHNRLDAQKGIQDMSHGTSKPIRPGQGSSVASPIPGAPHGVTAFVDVGVVPMDRDTVLMDQTVLVVDGRITALGPARKVHVPAGAMRIDSRGKFLLPGLADMHAHLQLGPHIGDAFPDGQFTELSAPSADSADEVQRLFLWLANGVTTIRDVDYFEIDSSRTIGRLALQFRARAAAGQEWIPHIYTAGEWGPGADIGYPNYYASSSLPVPNSVAAHVAAYKAAGYDFIKIHDESPFIIDSVLAAAKQVGIPVIGHVPTPTQVENILWGYHCIEHPVNDYRRRGTDYWAPLDTSGIRQLAASMAHAGVWSDPTLSHYNRLHYIPQVAADSRFVHPPNVLKILQDSGVKLLTGTDEPPWIGVLTRELEEFVNSGLTPYQALRASTWNVAEYFGTLNERGTIAVGKDADLLLLTGNPLQDIHYTARPAGVMLGGRWLSRAVIDARLAVMQFPTVTNDQVVMAPLKSYWHNVADMMWMTVREFLAFLYEPIDQTPYARLWQVLADSLEKDDHYAVGTQRMVTLFARQISQLRLSAVDDDNLRQVFDALARTWVERYRNGGYTVQIDGMPQ